MVAKSVRQIGSEDIILEEHGELVRSKVCLDIELHWSVVNLAFVDIAGLYKSLYDETIRCYLKNKSVASTAVMDVLCLNNFVS